MADTTTTFPTKRRSPGFFSRFSPQLPGGGGKIGNFNRREAIEGYLCIVPWLVGFLLFTAGPMLASVWLSLTDYEILRPIHFIGLDNFRNAAADPLFRKSLWNTLVYTALYVPLHLLTALSAAMLLNVKVSGIKYYRVIYYIPSIM